MIGKVMDLSNLAIKQDGFKVELEHPATGEILKCDSKQPQVMYVSVLSQDSAEYRRATSKVLRKQHADKGRKGEIDLDKTWDTSAQILAEVTTDCYLYIDGKVVEFSKEKMYEIYADNRFKWLKEQVGQASADRSNFIGG